MLCVHGGVHRCCSLMRRRPLTCARAGAVARGRERKAVVRAGCTHCARFRPRKSTQARERSVCATRQAQVSATR
eukprot:6182379-Pleurochrysis_carterae.AAC.2